MTVWNNLLQEECIYLQAHSIYCFYLCISLYWEGWMPWLIVFLHGNTFWSIYFWKESGCVFNTIQTRTCQGLHTSQLLCKMMPSWTLTKFPSLVFSCSTYQISLLTHFHKNQQTCSILFFLKKAATLISTLILSQCKCLKANMPGCLATALSLLSSSCSWFLWWYFSS